MKEVLINFVTKLIAVGAMLIGLVRELFAFADDASEPNGRQLLDADLTGECNHRTGRLVVGALSGR